MALKDNGKAMAAVVAAVALVLGIVGWAIFKAAILVPMVAAALGISTVTYVVMRRHFADIQARIINNAAQQEALFSIFSCLPLRAPLPAMGDWAASPDFCRALIGLILEHKPRTVVELGSGVSTLVSSYTLERLGNGGRVISLDHDAPFAETTRRNVALHGLDAIATVHHSPLCPHTLAGQTWIWYDTSALDGVDAIDLLTVDGPPETIQRLARYPAVPELIGRLAPGALVLLDDAIRAEEQEIIRRWMGEFLALERLPLTTEKGAALFRVRPAA